LKKYGEKFLKASMFDNLFVRKHVDLSKMSFGETRRNTFQKSLEFTPSTMRIRF